MTQERSQSHPLGPDAVEYDGRLSAFFQARPRLFGIAYRMNRARRLAAMADCESKRGREPDGILGNYGYTAVYLRIVPVFGPGALQASPRIGHLLDDLPWWWADASDNNTIDIAGLPPGEHKVKIELVDVNHNVFPGQSKTITLAIPKGASLSHSH